MADAAALRAYVTARDHELYARLPPGVVSLTVTHAALKSRTFPELRVDLATAVGELKHKLYRHTGTAPGSQLVWLVAGPQQHVALADDSRPLGFYGARSGMELRVVDADPHSLVNQGYVEDTSLVPKYVMPDEVYDKRENTVRRFKQKEREARQAEQDRAAQDADPSFVVGARCEVRAGKRRGEVRFVGPVPALGTGSAPWVGVALDEPMGSNDGSVNGVRLFTCAAKYGAFVRPENVRVGDFPVRDVMADGEDDDEASAEPCTAAACSHAHAHSHSHSDDEI